jgi:hypothetical protein
MKDAWRDGKYVKVLVEEREGRNHLGNLSVVGGITLK